jgi:magnesium-protoporphyrin O-methyltransferase
MLDAGCGTGALAVEAARRGAEVLAIDLSPTLVDWPANAPAATAGRRRVGRLPQRRHARPGAGQLRPRGGDGFADPLRAGDAVRVLAGLAQRTRGSMAFTFAPSTPALAAMHAVGRLFPRGDRAPAIVPVAEKLLRRMMARRPGLAHGTAGAPSASASGFYTSQALELGAPADEALRSVPLT